MKLEISRGNLRGTVDTHGGELISFLAAADGAGATEYIWNGDPKFWTGRNPILFPIVGNLKNQTVEIDGTAYHMNRHGFARNMEFAVADQGDDFVSLELRENAETLACYPFRFSLRVCHRILEHGFATSFHIENTDERPMPFCIGAHTAFRCPLHEGEQFSDYRVVFAEPEQADSILLTPDGLISADGRLPFLNGTDCFTPDYDLFGRLDTIIFDGLKSTSMSLLHDKTKHGVRMDFEGFPMVAFWTKPGAPYLCLEPWHGCAAAENESGQFEKKPHCMILAPKEAKDLTYTVTIL